MKSHFSRVVALGVLLCGSASSWAQPQDFVIPELFVEEDEDQQVGRLHFDLAEAGADAVALMGAFYNKMNRAESYRGRFVGSSTMIENGKVVFKRTVEYESGWVSDKERQDNIIKQFSNIVSTITLKDRAIVEKIRTVDNGIKKYRFNETKNVWSERDEEDDDTSFVFDATSETWTLTLASFAAGKKFTIKEEIVDNKKQVIVQRYTSHKYVFDGTTGHLLSWTHTFKNGSAEGHWLQSEFNVPLAAG